MRISKWLFPLLLMSLLTSCSGQQARTLLPIASPTLATSFLDFDHPRLHEIAGNRPLVIDELKRISSQDSIYVAIIVETGDPTLKHEMLLFRIKDNVPTLIYDLAPYVYMTFNIEHENHPSWLLDEIPPVGLPVLLSNGGNCYDCEHIVLINITQTGETKDITPVTDFVPKGFVEITGSGRAGRIAIVATQYYEGKYGAKSHVSSAYSFRLYEWDGNTYIDISKSEKDFYDEKIDEFTNDLKNTYGEPFDSDTMTLLANIFFGYESSGRVEYGWEQIKSLADLSHWNIQNTSPEELHSYQEVFDLLEKRKNQDQLTSTP